MPFSLSWHSAGICAQVCVCSALFLHFVWFSFLVFGGPFSSKGLMPVLNTWKIYFLCMWGFPFLSFSILSLWDSYHMNLGTLEAGFFSPCLLTFRSHVHFLSLTLFCIDLWASCCSFVTSVLFFGHILGVLVLFLICQHILVLLVR